MTYPSAPLKNMVRHGDEVGLQYEIIHRGHPGASVWVGFHGTGRSPADMLELIPQFAPEATVISPIGPIPFEGGTSFLDKCVDGSVELSSVNERAEQVEAFLERLVDRGEVPSEVFLCGYSSGATLVGVLLLRGQVRVARAILFRPAVIPIAVTLTRCQSGTHVLIIDGSEDSRRTPQDALGLVDRLCAIGADVRHVSVKAGHIPVHEDVATVRSWNKEVDDQNITGLQTVQ